MVLPSLKLAEKEITTEFPAYIMGILNVSGASFWEASNRADRSVDASVDVALKMIEDGADIIDIGGESTRPGSNYVTEEEELSRVVPVLKALRKKTDITVSIDTRKAAVMRAAVDEGADILNDVSAMEDDADMATLVSERKIPVVLMHKRGIPSDMQSNTAYTDIVSEVASYLAERALYAWNEGIEPDKIILDCGIGFGKNLEGNLKLIKASKAVADNVRETLIAKGADCKFLHVLAGLSRKSFIGQITGKNTADRLSGTITADLLAVQYGATMLRVHDVAAARDSLAVYRAMNEVN
jgi:dihydropteroate synthase